MRRALKALLPVILAASVAFTAESSHAFIEPPATLPNSAQHNEAIEFMKKNEFGKAAELEENILDRDPLDQTARFILAIAYLGMNAEKKAVEQAQSARESDAGFAAEIYGAMGRFFMTKARYHKSLVYFQEALKIKDDPGILRHVASIYLSQGLFKNARDCYERLLRTDPDYLNLSRINLAEGDFDKAIEYAGEVLKSEPDSPGAHLVLGTAYLLNGMAREAKGSFQALSRSNPEFFLTTYFLGVIGLIEEDYKEALKSFQSLIAISPGLREGLLNAAVTLQLQGELSQARDMALKAIDEDPLDPVARITLGGVLLSLGEGEKGREELGKAADLFPELQMPAKESDLLFGTSGREAAKVSLALLYNRAGLYRETVAYVPETEKNPLIRVLRARALERQGKLAQAEGEYRMIIEEHPGMVSAYTGLGELFESVNDFERAAEFFSKAARSAPESIRIRTKLADSYAKAGKVDDAAREYVKVISSARPVTAYRKLASLLADKRGDLKEALKYARKGSALDPEDAAMADTLGWIYYKMGRHGDALAVYSRLERNGDADSTALYRLGLVYIELGDHERAGSAIERALDLNDEFPGSEEAKQTLKRISGLS
ncbi:MAG: tetratricopeptide repeat protein [Deltaproteobacteria bacterium]|nr:tetratricopeptide repeat protein [Deltaproteobacteria bacterium]MBZ0219174.1 tetratricopeptide repeat protein [Deltaproteobacteria bacterium]